MVTFRNGKISITVLLAPAGTGYFVAAVACPP